MKQSKNQVFDHQIILNHLNHELTLQQQAKQTINLQNYTIKQWSYFEQYTLFFNPIQIHNFIQQSTQIQHHQSSLFDPIKALTDIWEKQANMSIIQNYFQKKLQKNGFLIHKINHNVNKPAHFQNINNHNFNKRKNKEIHISINVLKQTKNLEVVELFCQFGKYSKSYIVLNEANQSFRHAYQSASQGNMGRVYFCKKDKRIINSDAQNKINTVVKCLKFSPDQNLHFQEIKNYVKQFMIADMMSCLQIGPKITQINSFDFILFQNCFQFQMQECQNLRLQNLQSDVKQCLLQMHFLNIIHADIKPTNIMYSPTFKRNVLIDFGISTIIKQKIGQQTLTFFRGTYEYVSDEMKKIIAKKVKSSIDLYKNDVISLKSTLAQIVEGYFTRQTYTQSLIISYEHYSKPIIKLTQLSGVQFSNSSIKNLILELKYHLYFNQSLIKINSSFKQFIQYLDSLRIKYRQVFQIIFQQGLKFAQTLIDSQNSFQQCKAIIYNKASCTNHINFFNLQSFLPIQIFQQREQDQKWQDQKQPLTEMSQIKISNIQHYISIKQQTIKFQTHQQFKLRLNYLFNPNQQNDLGSNHGYRQGQNKKLIKDLREDNQSQNNQHYSVHKNKLQNIQFILFNKDQLERFSIQEALYLILQYISFWKITFRVSIDKKLKAAKLVRQFIQKQLAQSQKASNLSQSEKLHFPYTIQYQNIQYIPEELYISTNCKDISWLYGYMLSYCMKQPTSQQEAQFMNLNTMTILKDCIFLNFKYPKFIKKVFIKYFQRLIEKQTKDLITSAIIQIIELGYLTQQHFLVISGKHDHNWNHNNKGFIFIVGQAIQQLFQRVQNHKDKNIIKPQYKQKISILKRIHLLFQRQELNMNRVENLDSQRQKIMSQLVLTIESQFQLSQTQQLINQNCFEEQNIQAHRKASKTSFGKFQKAIKLLYFSIVQCQFAFKNKIKLKTRLFRTINNSIQLKRNYCNQFNIIDIIQAHYIRHQTKMIYQFVQRIDYQINCEQISHYLLLDVRFHRCPYRKNDYKTFLKILNLITQLKCASLLNYPIFVQIYPNINFISFFPSQYVKQTLQKILQIELQFIKSRFDKYIELKLIPQSQQRQLNKALLSICNIEQVNKPLVFQVKALDEIKEYLLNLISKIEDSLPQKLLLLIYYTILRITKIIDVQNMKIRRKTFKFLKEASIKYGLLLLMNSQDKQTKKQIGYFTFINQLNLTIQKQLLRYPYMPQQIKKYWKIKLKILNLYQNQQVEGQFANLVMNFIIQKQYIHLSEILVYFCQQKYKYSLSFHKYSRFTYCLQKMRQYKLDEVLFCTKLFEFINGISRINNHLNIHSSCFLDLYIHLLNYEDYFLKYKKKWKQMLKIVYALYLQCKNDQKSIKEQRLEQIIYLSLRYLEKAALMHSSNRKIMIIKRLLIKKFMNVSQFYRQPVIKYLQKFYEDHIQKKSHPLQYQQQKVSANIKFVISKKKKKMFENSIDCVLINSSPPPLIKQQINIKRINQAHNLYFSRQKQIVVNYQIQNCYVASRMKKWLKKNYGIKNTFLFQNKYMVEMYKKYQLVQKQEEDVDKENKKLQIVRMIELQIQALKSIEDFEICEDTIQLIDQVLEEQDRYVDEVSRNWPI